MAPSTVSLTPSRVPGLDRFTASVQWLPTKFSHPLGAELVAQHAVLLLDVVDDVLLLLVDPPRQGD